MKLALKMGNIVEKFNGLTGATLDRAEIERFISAARDQEQFHIVAKLQSLLDTYADDQFMIEEAKPQIEMVPASLLHGLDHEQVEEEQPGLAKAVSPNDVYQMIADKMLELIAQASGNGYKQKWKKNNYGTGYLIPFNFVSKKRYRGVNVFLLTSFGKLSNPFFMTFKQVDELGGKVKKGAMGYPVVYFTQLYKIEIPADDIDFGTYDRKKAVAFAQKNGIPEQKITQIPILKYYNVFNGNDIEGIDFDLENFKVGFINKPVPSNVDHRLAEAEAIIKNYPKPQPEIKHGGNSAAYYPGADYIKMPHIVDFVTVQDYYRTLFHELAHSTGNPKRLNRDFTGRFGDHKYAFEELIAEWGATFLSAEAGIIFHTDNNHAEYLKNWNNALTAIKEDNRFVMRACTEAQKLADYVLQFDDNGEPLYFKDLKAIQDEMATKKNDKKARAKTKKTVPADSEFVPGWFHKVFAIKKTSAPAEIYEMITTQAKAKKIYDKLLSNPDNDIIDCSQEFHVSNNKIKEVKTIKLTINKPKNNAEKLEKINPKPFDTKPKSVSVATAIKDVLTLAKFKEIGQRQASILYKHFKDVDTAEELHSVNLDSEFEAAMFKGKYSHFYSFFENADNELELAPLGCDLVQSINNRLISLKNQKHNYSLVDGLRGAREKRKRASKSVGLKSVVVSDPPQPQTSVPEAEVKTVPAIRVSPEQLKHIQVAAPGSLADKLSRPKELREYFQVDDPEISKFMGLIETKKSESVVVTVTGGQGSMKTRFLFQVMNAFAQHYKCGHASIEEHPDSALYEDKVRQYLNETAQHNITAPEIRTIEELDSLIRASDVIFIDSFQKLRDILSNFEVDKDLRKKYDGKLFFVIYQQTTSGKMKGGSSSQFDADVVLFTEKKPDYRENYIYPDKHRYNSLPTDQLKFNIFRGEMIQEQITDEPEETMAAAEPIKLSFQVIER